jgi:ABC-2 type transport system permease protein
MKGLLVKDFKLMKMQKNFFLAIISVSIFITITSANSSFTIGFLSFVGSLFTLSSISYDEFDNGNAFLFSLPITRKSYVIEKYSFGLIVGCASWLFGTIISLIAVLSKNTGSFSDTLMIASMVLPTTILLLAFILPFQLKFGGEKGRIAIIGVAGFMFAVGAIIMNIAQALGVDLIAVFNNLPALSMQMSLALLVVILLIILFISYRISLAIMNKKEF